MFQRILVPVDTVTNIDLLLPTVGRIARFCTGQVKLLGLNKPQVSIASLQAMAQHEALQWMVSQVEMVEYPLDTAIIAMIARYQADLVVMGSQCRRGMYHWGYQSLTEQVALSAPVPTLFIREHGTKAGVHLPEVGQTFRALLPLDGSPVAEAAFLPTAWLTAALAHPETGVIQFTQIVRYLAPTHHPNAMFAQIEQAQLYLENATKKCIALLPPAFPLQIQWATIHSVDTIGALSHIAEGDSGDTAMQPTEPFDLFAIGVRGPSGQEPYDISSVAGGVLHSTSLPYLAVNSGTHTT